MFNKTSIQKELLYLGIKPNLKGFDYIATAIEMYVSGIKLTYLYYAVAIVYKTTSSRVERDIRHAKDTMLNNEIMTLEEKFNNRYGLDISIGDNMTNGEFIALLRFAIENYVQV